MSVITRSEIKSLFDDLCEYYGKSSLSLVALDIYYEGLKNYSEDLLRQAIGKHASNAKNGQYMPKVADLIGILEGGELTPDEIIAAARLKKTPLGILCAIQIGSWDLKHCTDMFYLRQRAQECLQLISGWKDRAAEGQYTDHEISIMLKHDVNPIAPFSIGLPSPASHVVDSIANRVKGIENTSRHRFLLDHIDEQEYFGVSMNESLPEPTEQEINSLRGMVSKLKNKSGMEEVNSMGADKA